jgi:Putative addiction module component
MTQRELLAQQALKLPPEDRVYVADVLEQSLTSGGFTGPEIADAWASEIARRIDDFDRGQTQATDANDAIERLRQVLIKHRASKAG